MAKLNIVLGDRFGKLTVSKELDKVYIPSGQSNRVFECVCDCGNIKTVRLVHLSNHKTKSCGCSHRKRNGDGGTLLCKVWRGIKSRCDGTYFQNKYYFNKGIKVCDEWQQDFEPFKIWSINNGYVKGLQIDRIDNSGNYEPSNCRWVTSTINNNNRDNTIFLIYNNNKIAISDLLRSKQLDNYKAAILGRIKRGWSHDRAIDTPIKKGNYVGNKKLK
jgi:hypothetical protein